MILLIKIFTATAMMLYSFAPFKQFKIGMEKNPESNLAKAFLVHGVCSFFSAVFVLVYVFTFNLWWLLLAVLLINVVALISLLTYRGSKFKG